MHNQFYQKEANLKSDAKRFKSATDSILEKTHLNQQQLADEIDLYIRKNLSQKEVDAGFAFNLDKLKNLRKRPSNISSWILVTLQELYQINPDYIIGDSDDMTYKAGITYDCFKSIFPEWCTVTAEYQNQQGETINDKYLHVTCDSHLYDFLIKRESAKCMSEDGTVTFNENLQKYEEEFNSQTKPAYKSFVLLPAKNLDSLLRYLIVQDKSLPQDIGFEEVVDHAKFYSFLLVQKDNQTNNKN